RRECRQCCFFPPSRTLAGPVDLQHHFCHRRRGRTFARFAAQGKARHGVWGRDLASSNVTNYAPGTALPGRDDLGGTPLPPRLRRGEQPFGTRCSARRTFHCTPTPPAAAG